MWDVQNTCFSFWESGILVTVVITQARGSQPPPGPFASISDRQYFMSCPNSLLEELNVLWDFTGRDPWKLHLVSLDLASMNLFPCWFYIASFPGNKSYLWVRLHAKSYESSGSHQPWGWPWGPWHSWCHKWDLLEQSWLFEIQWKLVWKKKDERGGGGESPLMPG